VCVTGQPRGPPLPSAHTLTYIHTHTHAQLTHPHTHTHTGQPRGPPLPSAPVPSGGQLRRSDQRVRRLPSKVQGYLAHRQPCIYLAWGQLRRSERRRLPSEVAHPSPDSLSLSLAQSLALSLTHSLPHTLSHSHSLSGGQLRRCERRGRRLLRPPAALRGSSPFLMSEVPL